MRAQRRHLDYFEFRSAWRIGSTTSDGWLAPTYMVLRAVMGRLSRSAKGRPVGPA